MEVEVGLVAGSHNTGIRIEVYSRAPAKFAKGMDWRFIRIQLVETKLQKDNICYYNYDKE